MLVHAVGAAAPKLPSLSRQTLSSSFSIATPTETLWRTCESSEYYLNRRPVFGAVTLHQGRNAYRSWADCFSVGLKGVLEPRSALIHLAGTFARISICQ
jgi:hypothetical protein